MAVGKRDGIDVGDNVGLVGGDDGKSVAIDDRCLGLMGGDANVICPNKVFCKC